MFIATGLPSGLEVSSSTGLISGAPTVTGSFSATINVINLGGTGSALLSIVLATPPAPVISSSLSATGTDAFAFNYQITASNYPVAFSAGGLPPGVTCSGSTGLISGTPIMTGTFPGTISAMNLGGTDTESFTVIILPTPPGITSALSATGTYGAAFNYRITGSNIPTSFNATGLPAGLSVTPLTGVISGTPGQTGTTESQLQTNGTTWTLFTPLYAGKHPGSLAGTMVFDSSTTSDCNAIVDWIKPAQVSGAYYPGGFAALSVDLLAAKYAAPPLAPGPATITLTGGNLPAPGITDDLTISTRDGLTVNGSNDGGLNALSLTPGTGAFTGKFRDPVSNKETTFHGVIYQKPPAQGYGLFLGADESGAVSLTPQQSAD